MRLHLFLRGTDVIGDAIEPYQLPLAVKDSVGNVRVTIAGLPQATGVDNQPALTSCHRAIRQEILRGAFLGLIAVEYHRLVRVAYQAELRLEVGQVLKGSSGRQQVFPDRLSGAAVHQGKVTLLNNQG